MSTCVISGTAVSSSRDPLGDLLQRERVDVAGDRDVDDLLPVRELADDRFLGLDGEGG